MSSDRTRERTKGRWSNGSGGEGCRNRGPAKIMNTRAAQAMRTCSERKETGRCGRFRCRKRGIEKQMGGKWLISCFETRWPPMWISAVIVSCGTQEIGGFSWGYRGRWRVAKTLRNRCKLPVVTEEEGNGSASPHTKKKGSSETRIKWMGKNQKRLKTFFDGRKHVRRRQLKRMAQCCSGRGGGGAKHTDPKRVRKE